MDNVLLTAEEVKTLNDVSRERDPDVYLGDKLEAILAGTVDFESGTPVNADEADVVLTVDTQPTAGDNMTLGTKLYTFVAVGTDDTDGEISVGADVAAAKVNIVAAINGTDGHNVAHPLVTASAFATNDCTITAKVAGAAGNTIVSTETFTAETNVFSAATLTGGVNGTAALQGNVMFDASYLYVASDDNGNSDKNWGRVALDYNF